ncbi:nuclear transport factor 2 family protein [Sinomonas sp. ASV322]|uniref:nuclear transport factor 2 family protein n=1 Tax=Sinomonas sp. ASV322 TaxID=3041920 RepID=UPI0027DC607B|nr:nuclear transport factor 2 family protein [Sinomonas sp. ASV322]MDQ4504036.1 nuclear transport factor 2 family protein [Sinomonas sp. ASV322]
MTFPAMPPAVAEFYRGSQIPDADLWAGAFAADGVFHDPVGSEPIVGREAIRAKLTAVIPKFPGFYGLTPLTAHTVAGRTAVGWTGAVVAANGNPINWSGITIFTLDEDGLIADAAAYFNHDVFVAQLNGSSLLGVSPAH